MHCWTPFWRDFSACGLHGSVPFGGPCLVAVCTPCLAVCLAGLGYVFVCCFNMCYLDCLFVFLGNRGRIGDIQEPVLGCARVSPPHLLSFTPMESDAPSIAPKDAFLEI